MNQLATLFTLLGLLCYAEGRLCMLRGERGLAAAIAGTCAFGLLGALSKENGALTVAYALLIEFTCFRFDAAPRERRSLQAFFWLVVALPIALFTLYLALHPAYLSYSRNGFTLSTRLLSEARVLCDYLVWIFVPLPAFMSNRIHYTKPSITELEVRYVTDAATNGWGERCYEYIGRFERQFREHLGVRHAIATSSGTGALHIGMDSSQCRSCTLAPPRAGSVRWRSCATTRRP